MKNMEKSSVFPGPYIWPDQGDITQEDMAGIGLSLNQCWIHMRMLYNLLKPCSFEALANTDSSVQNKYCWVSIRSVMGIYSHDMQLNN